MLTRKHRRVRVRFLIRQRNVRCTKHTNVLIFFWFSWADRWAHFDTHFSFSFKHTSTRECHSFVHLQAHPSHKSLCLCSPLAFCLFMFSLFFLVPKNDSISNRNETRKKTTHHTNVIISTENGLKINAFALLTHYKQRIHIFCKYFLSHVRQSAFSAVFLRWREISVWPEI